MKNAFLSLFLVTTVFSSNAQEAPSRDAANSVAAFEAYQLAMEKVSKGRESIETEQKIGYRAVSKPKSDVQLETSSTLWLNNKGEEIKQAELGESSDQSGLNWEHNILVNPTRFPSNPRLIKGTDQFWVFELPVNIGVDAELEEEFDDSRVNRAINQALRAELIISKRESRIISHKIFSTKSFRPESMVKVSKFYVRMDYAEAWPGGPWVTQSISQEVEGKYAVFISINEFNNTVYSDFKLVE